MIANALFAICFVFNLESVVYKEPQHGRFCTSPVSPLATVPGSYLEIYHTSCTSFDILYIAHKP